MAHIDDGEDSPQQPRVVIDSDAPDLGQIEKVSRSWRRLVAEAAATQGQSPRGIRTRAVVSSGSTVLQPSAFAGRRAAPGVDRKVGGWVRELLGGRLPGDITTDALDAVSDLGKASTDDAPVYLGWAWDADFRIDARQFAATVDRLVQRATFKGETSIDGTIETLNDHSSPTTFLIYDVLRPQKGLKCTMGRSAADAWREVAIKMLEARALVTVQGEGTFVNNELQSVAVSSIAERPRACRALSDLAGALEGYEPIRRADW
jgi:hypothetical protein